MALSETQHNNLNFLLEAGMVNPVVKAAAFECIMNIASGGLEVIMTTGGVLALIVPNSGTVIDQSDSISSRNASNSSSALSTSSISRTGGVAP